MITDRTDAEKEEDHDGHDQERLDKRFDDLADGAVHVLRGVIDDAAVQAFGQLPGDGREGLAHAVDHREQVGGRRHLDADVHRALAVEGHRRVVVFGAERDLGHIAQADDGAVLRLDHEVAEFLHRVQARVRGQVHGHHLALGAAQRGDEVVGRQGVAHVRGGDAMGRHLLRIEPGPQRELAFAQDLGRLHALHGLQLRLHHADQVVGDLVRRQHLALEPDIHRIDGLADGHGDHGLLRVPGQLVQHRVDLGVDLGQGLVRIVVQAQVRLDGAHALPAR